MTDPGALRDAVMREMCRLEQAEATRQATEAQRDTAQAERDVVRGELARWTAGWPNDRAWQALIYRKGRSQ